MKYLLAFSLFAVVSCGFAGAETSYSVPLLKECEQTAENYMSRLADRFNLSYKLVKFDQVLPSHPEIIGYIDVRSDTQDSAALEGKVNALILDCYPISKIRIDGGPDMGDELVRILEENRRLGLKSYVVPDETGATVFIKNDY
jgi:hypothetical protein